jgi:hypothetical protein
MVRAETNKMQLHFDRAVIETLLKHTQDAEKHRLLYDDPATDKPGLWLVGDEGVYVMGNGLPPLLKDDGKALVCYADEVNPQKMDFSTWWAAKAKSFGGDDGCDFFAAADIAAALTTYRPGESLILHVTPKDIAILTYAPKQKPKRPARKPAR